jgi:hypothetical protein
VCGTVGVTKTGRWTEVTRKKKREREGGKKRARRYQTGDGEAVVVDGMALDADDVLQWPLPVELSGLVALHVSEMNYTTRYFVAVIIYQKIRNKIEESLSYENGEAVRLEDQTLHFRVEPVWADNHQTFFNGVAPVLFNQNELTFCDLARDTARRRTPRKRAAFPLL